MCKQKITQKFLSTPKNTQITELKNQFKKHQKRIINKNFLVKNKPTTSVEIESENEEETVDRVRSEDSLEKTPRPTRKNKKNALN